MKGGREERRGEGREVWKEGGGILSKTFFTVCLENGENFQHYSAMMLCLCSE